MLMDYAAEKLHSAINKYMKVNEAIWHDSSCFELLFRLAQLEIPHPGLDA